MNERHDHLKVDELIKTGPPPPDGGKGTSYNLLCTVSCLENLETKEHVKESDN